MVPSNGGLDYPGGVVRRQYSPSRQRGTAILLALMFMALSATLAVALTFSQTISIRLTSSIQDLDRMVFAAQEVTDWAARKLVRTTETADENANEADTLTQDWAKPMPELTIDQMTVQGDIVDLNRYFDLNQFATQPGDDKASTTYSRQVTHRLLQLIAEAGGDELDALALTDAIAQSIASGKAKTLSYQNKPATQPLPLQSISELRLIAGIGPSLYRKMQDLFTVVPVETQQQAKQKWRVNINTAKLEVLAAMLNINTDEARPIITGRPYQDMRAAGGALDRIKKQLPHAATKAATKMLSVHSHYFLVRSQVWQESAHLTVYTLFKRHQSGWLQELWYSRGTQ